MDNTTLHSTADALARQAEAAFEARLWQRWRVETDVEARTQLIQLHLPHARVMAAMVYKGRFHDEVEFDEYLQLAAVGLVEAVERFDPQQGAQFKTYASHRMRGAILNGLKKLTEKNQQIAASQRLRKERLDALKAEAKEQTSPGQQQQPLLGYLAEVGIGLALGMMLEGTAMLVQDDTEDTSAAASPEVSYFRKSETQQLQTLLRTLIDRLPEQERRVIRSHYQQEIPFDEISATLEVTRSRVSQLHRQGLLNLRKALAQMPPCDVVW